MKGREHITAIILSILIISSMIIYATAQQLFITTDKPTYTAGDRVIVSGYGPADSILVMMVYLTNKTLDLEQLSLGDTGNFTITLPALSLVNPGTYTVWIAGKAYSKGELVGETTTSFIYIIPGAETNTTTPTNTTTNTTTATTVTLTETTTVTETQTVTETLVKTKTVTDTTTVTRNVTITETETQTVTETQTTTVTETQTETTTQTQTITQTQTTTTTETQTTTKTTTLLRTTTETQTVTAPAPLAEKIVYLVVGLFVGIAITYAMRVLTTKQQ